MADSADVLLARARNALARWANAKPGTSAEWMSATDLVDAVTDLDALLSSGGPLPTAWADRTPSRPVTDVPLTDQISIKVTADNRMPPGTAAMTGADGQIHVITGIGEEGVL